MYIWLFVFVALAALGKPLLFSKGGGPAHLSFGAYSRRIYEAKRPVGRYRSSGYTAAIERLLWPLTFGRGRRGGHPAAAQSQRQ